MKRGTPQKDVLDLMSKEELVAWIRTRVIYLRPKMSEVLYLRWEKQSQAVHEERLKEAQALSEIDTAEHDRLAARFNQSKDAAERLRLLEQMEPYRKAVRDYVKRYEAIDRKQKKLDALYKQIDVEREKEQHT